MRFKNLYGKEVFKNIQKYRIDWDKPSLSKFQFAVKQFLRPYWKSSICFEEMPVTGTRMRIDIYNATKRIACEVMGEFHRNFNKHFHKENTDNYLNQIKRDLKKSQWCELNRIDLIEIWPEDLPKLSSEWFKNKGIDL